MRRHRGKTQSSCPNLGSPRRRASPAHRSQRKSVRRISFPHSTCSNRISRLLDGPPPQHVFWFAIHFDITLRIVNSITCVCVPPLQTRRSRWLNSAFHRPSVKLFSDRGLEKKRGRGVSRIGFPYPLDWSTSKNFQERMCCRCRERWN